MWGYSKVTSRILLTTAGLAALGIGPATATDLAPPPIYTKAPPAIPVAPGWAGFYLGLNVGGASGQVSYSYFDTFVEFGAFDEHGVILDFGDAFTVRGNTKDAYFVFFPDVHRVLCAFSAVLGVFWSSLFRT